MLSPVVSSRLAALQADSAVELDNIVELAQRSVDAQLLALCTSCIEAALRCEQWHPPEAGLSDKEQAFIAFTEQFVMSVSTMDRDQVVRLLDYASADEVYAFIHAIYVADMALRLEIVGREVLV